MGFLTGKSKQKSASDSLSENVAFPDIKEGFGGLFGNATEGSDMVRSMLSGGPGGAGMDFIRDQGSQAITGNKAANGLLRSGSTLTALEKFGQGVGSTYLQQYLDNAFKFGNMGLQAGQLVSGAGNRATSTSSGSGSSKPGLGSMMSMIPGM